MAQWQELLKLDSALQNQVRQLYEGRFPTEIRNQLSQWTESQDCGHWTRTNCPCCRPRSWVGPTEPEPPTSSMFLLPYMQWIRLA
uniref:STAT transcription factor protein interaction domain-containing protein n=1 Tax=Xiphophorus couchianus TaxID=32473 RepID=A0A3B5MQ18_9TELE